MKKITLVIMLFTLSVNSQNIQEQHQRAKIYYTSFNELALLDQVGIPIDHGIHEKNQYFISDFSISEISKIREAGFEVDILIEDSKEYYLQQNRNISNAPINESCVQDGYQTPENFEFGSMGGYFTYQEMLDQLDLMKSLYPNLITDKENISTFLTEGEPDNATTPPIGGNGIKWVKISDNPENSSEGEAQILYTAVHHAREPTSLSQLIFYMWYLLENYDTDYEIKNIVDNTELYFIPVVNPDGYLYNEKTDPNGGGFWRKNRKNGTGVDNNRNYDYYIDGDSNNGIWSGEGTSSDPTSNIYHGEAPFSEIENQAVKWFCEEHDFVMAFNNHSYGDLLLYPYGYTENMPTPDHSLYMLISEELVSKNNYANQLAADLYPAAGTSDDFMYGTVGTHSKIIAFIPEIGNSFWLSTDQIIPTCKDMMYLNITSAKMASQGVHFEDLSPEFTGDQSITVFQFNLKYLGLENNDITISLNPISSNVSFSGTPIILENTETLEEATPSFQYIIESGTNTGDPIDFEIIINNGVYDYTIPIYKKFGEHQTVFEDNGDSATDNFTTDGWEVTNEDFVSPSTSITDSPNENYQNNENKTITLINEIDLTNAVNASLSFNAKWSIHTNWDYVQVLVSTDNSQTWTPQCGNYTVLGNDLGFQPEGEPLYSDIMNDWVLEEISFNEYLGENILIRFQLVTNGFGIQDGFYFDDLTVTIVEDDILNIDDFISPQFSIYPNPTNNLLNITTPISDYKLNIYNIQGQLISTFSLSGSQTLDISTYSKGIYLLKLTTKSVSKTYKIIKD
ncbi:MAG: carboxypeptidase T [bacterium]|jgi:carboxypeptidase T